MAGITLYCAIKWPQVSSSECCSAAVLQCSDCRAIKSPCNLTKVSRAGAGARVTVMLIQLLQTKAIRKFVITEKVPTRAFSWLKAASTAFTFKTLLRHYG